MSYFVQQLAKMSGITAILFLFFLSGIYAAGYGSSSGGSSTPQPSKKYRVTSIVLSPFLEAADEDGNYSGFIPDILNAFKDLGGFDYVINESPSGIFGDFYADGTSDGAINELVTGKTDIIAGDLTQTYNRTLAVDFTQLIYLNQFRIAVNKDYNADTVKYIVWNDTGLLTFLERNRVNPLVAKIWSSIQAGSPDSYVAANEEGVRRVAEGGNIAFVSDTPYLTIEVLKRADKVSVTGDNLAFNWFAFAVAKDSPLRLLLNDKLLAIQENGVKDVLDRRFPKACNS